MPGSGLMPMLKGIRIGNQTAFSASGVLEPFDYAVLNGFDAFEWFPDRKEDGQGWDDLSIGSDLRARIRQTAQEHDIMLTVHAPWNADASTPEGRELLLRNIGFACDIGAALVNIHLSAPDGPAGFLDSLRPVALQAADKGLLLSIENTVVTGPDDFNRLFRLVRESDNLPAESLGMCLDIGHANLCSETRNDYLGFMDRLDPSVPIFHVHLHENYGDADRHLPLFTGPSARDVTGIRGVVRRLRARSFRGAIILEQWPHPPALLNNARDRLADLFRKEEEPVDRASGSPARGMDEKAFFNALVRMHGATRSWREKLDGVRTILKDDARGMTGEHLVYLAVYLRLLSLGMIAVKEDGGHHRPDHLARISLDIDERLRGLSSAQNVFILRKIRPYLPSGDPVYQRSEPLTRIRDIAHRNDIPKDLKHEIKHTLQNKLHRCAGPEDLLTATRLLERITAKEGDYNPAFVAEFRLFHQELEDFFNAHTLERRLLKIIPLLKEPGASLAGSFISAAREMRDPLLILGLLADVRGRIAVEADGFRGFQAQQAFLCDAGMEDFAFSLLGGIATASDHEEWDPPRWAQALSAVSLGAANLGLSSIEPEECGAVVSEIRALYGSVDPCDRDQMLMIRALCGRVLRLTEGYAERILGLFASRAESLGRSLGVTRENLRYYTENDLREHLVFPLSRLVVSVSGRVRRALDLPPWDPVVAGSCRGRLTPVARIGDAGVPADDEKKIVLAGRIEGDEEIPGWVSGVIVRHQLPHLCHFCVRARQQGTVVAVCDDRAECEDLERMTGEQVRMSVTAEAVSISRGGGRAERMTAHPKERGFEGDDAVADLSVGPVLHALDDITVARGGGKAWAIRRLRDLARVPGSGFVVPDGVVIPFGVMDEALGADPDISRRYVKLARETGSREARDFGGILAEIRRLITESGVPAEVISGIAGRFGSGTPLIVRSSALDEDGHLIAGAGIYASVPNVRGDGVREAVLVVWRSLWSDAAAAQRRAHSLPPDKARMAAVVQPVVIPDLSFVVHTANPLSGSRDELYAELAAGHGEIIASSVRSGTPYRMVCDKRTGAFRMSAFANFSAALTAGESGLAAVTADYSLQGMHADGQFRALVAGRLVSVSRQVEDAFGGPQDIEGGFVGDTLYLFQTRPQQGL